MAGTHLLTCLVLENLSDGYVGLIGLIGFIGLTGLTGLLGLTGLTGLTGLIDLIRFEFLQSSGEANCESVTD